MEFESVDFLEIQTSNYENDIYSIIAESDFSSVFHTPLWLKAISEITGTKGFYLIIKTNNIVDGIIPFFEVKKEKGVEFRSGEAFFETIYGGFIPTSKTSEQEIYYTEIINYLFKEKKCLSVNISPVPEFSTTDFKNNKPKKLCLTSLMNIEQDINSIWGSMNKKSVRYIVNRCKRQGVTLFCNRPDDLELFYYTMTRIFNDKGRDPIDFSIYKQIFTMFTNENSKNLTNGIFYSLFLENEFLGGVIGISFKDKLYYLSSAITEKGKEIGANDFLLWELIKWGNIQGCKTFDLLRFSGMDDKIGQFKMKYSKDISQLYNFDITSKYGYFRKIIRHLHNPSNIIKKINCL